MAAVSKVDGRYASGRPQPLSIVIPTYGREQVLIDSVSALLDLDHPADEILVVDQTRHHDKETVQRLEGWNSDGQIRWIQRDKPSITESMNHGLQVAKNPLVLFLDDDIRPHSQLVLNHARAHAENGDLWATVGQVIQPWQSSADLAPPRRLNGLQKDFDFPFHSTRDADVENVMAGNLCVHRQRALSIGGFDENFVGAAYRFETDFARRIVQAGGRIRFIGSAGIDHLRVSSGGTRTGVSHLTSASPLHGFGDYYYALRHGTRGQAFAYSGRRFLREVRTRFHLTHPWWIPVKLLGELRAMRRARSVARDGRNLIQ